MTQHLQVTGGCQCGSIRYRAILDPGTAHICHCRMCQKATGNYFMPLASAALATFTLIRGTLSRFRSSAEVERGFCSQCGTPLTFAILGRERISIALGSLDNPALIEPGIQAGVESRMPWFHALAGKSGTVSGDGEPNGPARIAGVAASSRQHPDHDTGRWP